MAGPSKRIAADIAEMNKPEYAKMGIFYEADETNVNHGYALIFGPKDTPYEDCPMFYEFHLPPTFPFDPPAVKFLTYDGNTRFHPNMYVEGKVCLSILGTWAGERWASTMRLSTVLVTLQSLMDKDPIRHEPSYANSTSPQYSKFVEHRCTEYVLRWADLLLPPKTASAIPPYWTAFEEVFLERLPQILEGLAARLEARISQTPQPTQVSAPYSLVLTTNYPRLLDTARKLKERTPTP